MATIQAEEIKVDDIIKIDLPCWVTVTKVEKATDGNTMRGNLIVTFDQSSIECDVPQRYAGVVRIGSKVNVEVIKK